MKLTSLAGDADPEIENLADGGTWLLDLVAAVDHLRRGYRPSFTVWDAIGEALTDRAAEANSPGPIGPGLLAAEESAAWAQAAIRRWVVCMADRYNNGHHWPHPQARRGFPPPVLHEL